MWIKVLAIREIRQARAIIWVLPIIHFLVLGLQRINIWFTEEQRWIDQRITNTHSTLEAYEFGGLEIGSRAWLVIALFLLALIQLGAERRNGTQEFLFSLPYSRRQIYITKWLVGVGLLAGSLVLNTGLDMAVMASSPVSQYFSFTFHVNQFLYSLLVGMAYYSIALLIGAICGSIASQAVLSFILFILPIATWQMVDNFLMVHRIGSRNEYYGSIYENNYYDYFSLFGYIEVSYDFISLTHVLVVGLILLIAAWGGIRAYERNRTENNGKLLIFKVWERIVEVGFVVYFSLFMGSISANIFVMANDQYIYDIGLVVGVLLGILIIRRLTRLRLKI